ncbi:MAG: hypothetical protein A3F43_01485 [Gammaproteobacteria bacterium RIFCSPHIGHO2_12_FULL_42_10]|nr:MAG: hypothetical protein A3F43_01485 [Gammaproteobacteria bacterium RIFCSPHIGHO2_12_FULL_42_10]
MPNNTRVLMLANRTKRLLFLTLKLAFAVGLIWVLVHSATLNMRLLVDLFKQPFAFGVVLLLLLTMVITGAWRWYVLNCAQNITFCFSRTVFVTYLCTALNYVTPGAVGGDFVRAFYVLKHASNKKSAVLLTAFLDRLIGLWTVFFLMSAACLVRFSIVAHQSQLKYLFVTSSIASLGLLVVFFSMLWVFSYVATSVAWVKRLSQFVWLRPLFSFARQINLFKLDKKIIAQCVLLSVTSQILVTTTIMLISSMMGFPLATFFDFMIAACVTQIVNLIPLTPGGIGIGEMAFSHVLSWLNPSLQAPYATVFFAYRLLGVLTYLPGAIYYSVTHRTAVRILPAAGELLVE